MLLFIKSLLCAGGHAGQRSALSSVMAPEGMHFFSHFAEEKTEPQNDDST